MYKMSSSDVEWKYFEESDIPRGCWFIVIVVVVLILVGCIVGLIVWDSPTNDQAVGPRVRPTRSKRSKRSRIGKDGTLNPGQSGVDTIDHFSFSQRVVAQMGKSSQSEVRTSDGSIVGDVRQIFVVPPTTASAQVIVNNSSLYYEYKGDKANGFEVRWLNYVTKGSPTVKSIDLGDVDSFDVDVESLNLDPGATFTMQMNVKDVEGLESSVVSIVDSTRVVKFRKSSFLGDGPNERPDFTQISGMWLGGDFRSGGGSIKIGNLKFNK